MRQWLRDMLIALSLVNLCFLSTWSTLLTFTRADTYFMTAPPLPKLYEAVILNVLLLGGLLWLTVTMVRRYFTGRAQLLAHGAFLLLLLIPLNALRDMLGRSMPHLKGELFRAIGEAGVSDPGGLCHVLCGYTSALGRKVLSDCRAGLADPVPICAHDDVRRNSRSNLPGASRVCHKTTRSPYTRREDDATGAVDHL